MDTKTDGLAAAGVETATRDYRRIIAFQLSLVGFAAASVYLGTIDHQFVYDDILNILGNPRISGFDSLHQSVGLLFEPWRAITNLSYALTHYFFGFDARAFHLGNIIIHAANAVLVFGIARRISTVWAADSGDISWLPLAAGIVFAVHPLHSEAVAYVWGRSSSLCALFYFGSILLTATGYGRSRKWIRYFWYTLALFSGALAWKSKEEAITLPFVIAGFFLLNRAWRAAASMAAALFLLIASRWTAISALYSQVRENRGLVAVGLDPAPDFFAYLLTSVKAAVFYYLRRFILPVGLTADPPVEIVSEAWDPLFLAAALVLIILAAGGLLMVGRNRMVSFSVLALLASPLLSYASMPLADVVAEHRVYIAGIGFALLIGCLVTRTGSLAPVWICILALAMGYLTVERSKVWADSLTLWSDAVEKAPGLVRPRMNLGFAHCSAGHLDAGLAQYRRALEIRPDFTPAYVNIAGILLGRNDLEAAERELIKAQELSLGHCLVDFNLAMIDIRKNQPEQALQHLEAAAAAENAIPADPSREAIRSDIKRYRVAIEDYMSSSRDGDVRSHVVAKLRK